MAGEYPALAIATTKWLIWRSNRTLLPVQSHQFGLEFTALEIYLLVSLFVKLGEMLGG